MVYSHFSTRVVIHVGLIVLLGLVFAYLVVATTYVATISLVMLLLGLQVAALLRYVLRTNRELSRFLLMIEHTDFSPSFASLQSTGGFGELSTAFERVLARFREMRSAREEQSNYLYTLVQHVPVAVIATDVSGHVEIFNNAARRLFGVSELRNLHDFTEFGPEFPAQVLRLDVGAPELVKVRRGGEVLQLNVCCIELRLRSREVRIITLQDIHRELEVRELTAWQDLIRVLAHEIMNSMTPLTSLAATAGDLLADAQSPATPAADAADAIRDAKSAVDTIAERGKGLVRFVQSYRRLTQVPVPQARVFAVEELFARINQLMACDLAANSVSMTQLVEKDAALIVADPELVEQAILNVVKNSIDAVRGASSPHITLAARVDEGGRPMITVTDNGHGMEGGVREKIFVPFFTTKRDGTGVGLSVVQQIMLSHQGSVEVVSEVGKGTELRLAF